MSKKDFERFAALFAGELALAATFSDLTTRVALKYSTRSIILSTADIFAQSNPRFDRARFYLASGLDKDGFLV